MGTDTPTLFAKDVTLTIGDVTLHGDIYAETFVKGGGKCLVLVTPDGDTETLTINLIPQGFLPEFGGEFAKPEHAAALVAAGLGKIGRTVTYGPYRTQAKEVFFTV